MFRIQRTVLQNSGRPTRVTQLRLTGPHAEIRFEIAERFTTRQRRAVVNSLLRQLKPWLKFFLVGRVTHEGEAAPNFRREELRMQPWIKGEKFGDSIDKHSLGLLIRLKRTHLGLTQEELAKQLRINRGNLVEIETGKVQPREQTLVRIMTALKPTKTDIRRTPCGAESCPWPEATMSALAEPKPKPKSNHFQ